MPKIKEIIITDFRAYLGEAKFSFNGKLGLSNLVVIYGPNGFGKTSFFDAVEWTFSNKIKRFETGVLKSELESKDYSNNDLIVLSNRHATSAGKIRISTDDEKYMERTVSPRKVQNEEIRYDYRSGSLSGDYTDIELSLLSETNILTQDQIDSFLRFMSPEEKFDALKEFWPKGEEAANVFKNLTQYQRIVANSTQLTLKEIGRLENEINRFLNSEQNFIAINSRIELLNASKFYAFNYPKITTDIDEKVYSSIIETNETHKKLIKNLIDDQQIYSVKLSDLIRDYNTYKINTSLAKENQTVLLKFLKVEEDLEAIKIHQKSIADIDIAISQNELRKKDVEALSNGWQDFMSQVYQISYLNAEITNSLQVNDELIYTKNIFKESHIALKYAKEHQADALREEKKLNGLIDFNKAKISQLTQDQKDGNEILEFLELTISEIESKMEALIARRYDLQSFNGEYEKNKIGVEFDNLLEELNQSKKNIKSIENQISDAQSELKKKETFSEGLDRIIQWGLFHVKEHSLTDCPMCQTNFADVDSLLKSIQREKLEIINPSDFANDINEKSLIAIYLKEHCGYLEAKLEEILAEQIDVISSEITEHQHNKDLTYNRKADVSNKTDYAESARNSILEIFTEQYSSFENSIDFDEVREISDLRIVKYGNKIDRLSVLINWKEQKIRESDNNILAAKFNHESNQNKIQLIVDQDEFKLIESLLIKYQLRAHEITDELLTTNIDSFVNALALANVRKKELSELIEKTRASLSSENILMNDTDLKLLISKQQSTLDITNNEIKRYETDYQIILNKNDYNSQIIEDRLIDSNTRLEGYLGLKAMLEEFSADLEVVKENIEKNALSKLLIDQNGKLIQLGIVKQKIDNAKSACGNYINHGIDIYFNKDTINKIYGKIEPHPNLREIDIKSEIHDGDKSPKLLIRAKNDIDELNPTLYLSTGQVNVLSLSIFLAKAFELGSEKINTIFMDDPVQNLSDINVLSFIDLIRTLILDQDKQVVISTHDEKFFKLLQNKLSDDYFKAKYIELIAFGKLKDEGNTLSPQIN